MTDITRDAASRPRIRPFAGPGEEIDVTPAGLQDKRDLASRRMVMAGLCLGSMALLTWGVASVFGAGGWSVSDVVIMACFLVGAPWTVMGVWNSVIGLWLLHGRQDGITAAAPHLDEIDESRPITGRTAVTMTLRNEDPAGSLRRMAEMRASLDATGQGDRFDIHFLSDTSDPEIAAREEALFHAMRPRLGGARAHYRRRSVNTGFKAGNMRDFLCHAGRDYEFFLPLDSDSLMSGEAMTRMVRIMETHPRLGILQSLVVGAPSKSFFARIFQFGMRHGMRSHTIGAAWWQGDCGPFWGHNAVIRTTAFRRHCRLPVLPGRPPLGGHILSHDQVEAVLMRRAGYEVRVIPVEGESWEENPPTLMDFTKRDLRWCQGNMQYWGLLGLRGLRPTSRFQLFAAIAMYLGAPAWMLMTTAAGFKLFETGEGAQIDLTLGLAMFFIMFSVSLCPKLLGMADILLSRGGTARYGGSFRFLATGLAEMVFSILMAPVVAFRVTLFLVGLVFGRTVTWSGQNRDAYSLTWGDAARGLWPQTLFGLALLALVLGFTGGMLAWVAAPMIAGLALSIPFAVITASPRLGRWAAETGLGAIPDEIAPAPVLRRAEGKGPPVASSEDPLQAA